MKLRLPLVLSISLLGTAASGFATESIDISVNGSIQPPACNLELPDGGVYNLGTVSAMTLNQTTGTRLPEKRVELTISCNAATKFYIQTADNRAGSAGQSAVKFAKGRINVPDGGALGLGLVNDTTVGIWSARFLVNGVLGDGNGIKSIYSGDNGDSWLSEASELRAYGIFAQPGKMVHGFTTPDGTSPTAFTTVVQPIWINVYTNSAETLPPLTDDVPMDGSLTLQIHYI